LSLRRHERSNLQLQTTDVDGRGRPRAVRADRRAIDAQFRAIEMRMLLRELT
jgi:hypothetical protein